MCRSSCVVLLAVAALVSACAQPPGSIAPVGVSSSDFDAMDCGLLARKIRENQVMLEDAERRQRGALAGDAAGVFLVLIPPSVFLGDASDEVALGKGNAIAMERSYQNHCV